MKNLIKKILIESELDWIKEVPVNPLTRHQFVVIWFDRSPTKNDINTITRWWNEIHGTDDFSFYNFPKGGYIRFNMDENDDVYDFGYGSSIRVFKGLSGSDEYTQYKLSELIPSSN